jgi:hypothetical protein
MEGRKTGKLRNNYGKNKELVEATNKMQPCNRIYYSKVY